MMHSYNTGNYCSSEFHPPSGTHNRIQSFWKLDMNRGLRSSGMLCGKRLRWSRGSVLPLSTQVHGVRTRPKPVRIFQGEKILGAPSFGGGSKAVGPVSQICGM